MIAKGVRIERKINDRWIEVSHQWGAFDGDAVRIPADGPEPLAGDRLIIGSHPIVVVSEVEKIGTGALRLRTKEFVDEPSSSGVLGWLFGRKA